MTKHDIAGGGDAAVAHEMALKINDVYDVVYRARSLIRAAFTVSDELVSDPQAVEPLQSVINEAEKKTGEALAKLERVIAIASAPAASESPLTALGDELERVWAIERAGLAKGGLADADVDAYVGATSEVVERILAQPATTLDDFKVKARALASCLGSDDVSDLFQPPPTTTDARAVQSIIRDLLAASA
jgi:hypothetical protein